MVASLPIEIPLIQLEERLLRSIRQGGAGLHELADVMSVRSGTDQVNIHRKRKAVADLVIRITGGNVYSREAAVNRRNLESQELPMRRLVGKIKTKRGFLHFNLPGRMKVGGQPDVGPLGPRHRQILGKLAGATSHRPTAKAAAPAEPHPAKADRPVTPIGSPCLASGIDEKEAVM